jgi:D-tyrosyl-tRNA(Tyr) deacylase
MQRNKLEMRAVVQRVSRAAVHVVEGAERETTGAIGPGLLALVGVHTADTDSDARTLADKIANLRIFTDAEDKLNLSLLDTGGSALVISNFTLYGDCRKGRRPSFTEAAGGPKAEALYLLFGDLLAASGVPVQYGRFGAHMEVELVNDGPVTLLLDSRKTF